MESDEIFRWQYLMKKYLENKISRLELNELLEMAGDLENSEAFSDLLRKYWETVKETAPQSNPDLVERFNRLLDSESGKKQPVPVYAKQRAAFRYRAAAVAIGTLLLGTALYFWSGTQKPRVQLAKSDTRQKQYAKELKPGTDGAILTLDDGRQIDLDSNGNTTLELREKNIAINKNGKISYQHTQQTKAAVFYNTVTTVKGKQYQVELSDGSRVWLNAASSIRFPVIFTGAERMVDITGEAYFEVAKQRAANSKGNTPFIVRFHTPAGTEAMVRVLGTHFNINTYGDETSAKTSLLEGSVQVMLKDGKPALLTPGQQARIDRTNQVDVANNVDMDAVIAWKNGYFSFNKTDLTSLMRQIARWYNVDVVYQGAVPDRIFGGEISRSSDASQVLKILEESKINFKIEGKKIIVLP